MEEKRVAFDQKEKLNSPLIHFEKYLTNYRATRLGDLLVFLLPMLGLLKIHLIGELYVHEMILLFILPGLMARRGKLLYDEYARIFFRLTGIWFLSQVVTDLYRLSPFEDWTRGWAKIIFFIISFASLFLLITTQRRLLLWMVGSIPLAIIQPMLNLKPDAGFAVLWKFGLGGGILQFFILCVVWIEIQHANPKRYAFSLGILFFIFAVLSLFFNSRSGAGISLINAVLLFAFAIPKIHQNIHKLLEKRPAMIIGILALLSFLVLAAYSSGAESGLFGEEAQLKFRMQNIAGFGPLGILLGGRSEFFASIVAIGDSPIIGHGSWAKDPKYAEIAALTRMEFKEEEQTARDGLIPDLIPTHSHVFGAWVEAGILGAVFWGTVLFWAYKAFKRAWSSNHFLAPLMMSGFMGTCWNVVFSPFGATARVTWAGSLIILIFFNRSFEMKKEIP
ncbi:MAG: hypothetical protein WA705_12560 [Candidatus Ozemobacteraceae bacterium]